MPNAECRFTHRLKCPYADFVGFLGHVFNMSVRRSPNSIRTHDPLVIIAA